MTSVKSPVNSVYERSGTGEMAQPASASPIVRAYPASVSAINTQATACRAHGMRCNSTSFGGKS